ncbi:MAG: acylphosphatase [Candidatus Nanoarchaeia archaeon]
MRLHVIIKGHVQGVFFRDGLQGEAEVRSITGWVRNNADGTVEAVAEGEEKALKELLAYCQKGPSAASVESVKEDWSDGTGEFSDFTY